MPSCLAGLSELDSISALLPAFEFEGVIASGPVGTVYRASQRSLDRHVAIRIIPRGQFGEPSFRAEFKAGVKAMASLTHPHLIRVFDSGDVEGFSYMVMEYVPGKSLHHSAHGKAIDPRQAAQIIIAACEGLAHAHGNGIVHGAIKPTDILLTSNCEPKIGNFGFARHDSAEDSAYMAPELAGGGVYGTPQTDVYAIGVVLRELLTGVSAASVDAERVVIHDPRLADICHKATHPDPALRTADAISLAKALKAWMSSGSLKTATRPRHVSAYRPKPLAMRHSAPRPGLVMLKHCAVIGFLLVAIHSLWGVYQEKQETLARLQKAEDAKPRVIIVKRDAVEQTPQSIDTAIVQLESEP